MSRPRKKRKAERPEKLKKKLTSPKPFLYGKKCFQTHQDSTCHEAAASCEIAISQCENIGELMDNQQSKKRATGWKYFLVSSNSLDISVDKE